MAAPLLALTGLDRLKADQRAGADRTPPLAVAPKPARSPISQIHLPVRRFHRQIHHKTNSLALQVLQSLPADLYPRTLADLSEAKRQAINIALRERVAGKQATLTVVVTRVDSHDPDCPILDVQKTPLGPFTVDAVMFFDRRFKDQGVGFKVGTTYMVTGTIGAVGFHDSTLFFNMNTCHAVGPNAPPHSDEKVTAADNARKRLAETAGNAPKEFAASIKSSG